MSMELIQRLATGQINNVNDSIAGGGGGNIGPQVGYAPGQLGKILELDDSEVAPLTATGGSNLAAIYGGGFQYVRLSASAAVPIPGQILFWDILSNAVDNLFQVTTAESGSTDTAMLRAGICLTPSLTVGNYTFIQIWGPCYVKFRATLTAAGAAGSRVYAAAAGGADLGFADVIDSANPTLFSDVSKMEGRWIGVAQEAPTSGGLKRVYVEKGRPRG